MITFNNQNFKLKNFREFVRSVENHDYDFLVGCKFITCTGKEAKLTKIISAKSSSDFPLLMEYKLPEKTGSVEIFDLCSDDIMVLMCDPREFPKDLIEII